MNFRILIYTILFCSQSKIAFSQTIKNDTTFLFKDSLKGFSQSIFIETNKISRYYADITSFVLDSFERESYFQSLNFLKKKKIKLKKQKPILPANKWVILKQYKGEYCAYHPCDFYTFFKASINDSTYIDWTGEGPIANKIMNQKKINDSTFIITTYGVNSLLRQITIQIIDKQKGIAKFTEIENEDFQNIYYMIMAEKIRTVPFIVNNCEIYKQREYEFEKRKSL